MIHRYFRRPGSFRRLVLLAISVLILVAILHTVNLNESGETKNVSQVEHDEPIIQGPTESKTQGKQQPPKDVEPDEPEQLVIAPPITGTSAQEDIQHCIDMRTSYKDIVECIVEFNQNSPIRNREQFAKIPLDDDLIIAIIAHKRRNYLEKVIESLRKVEGIEQVLLVISHDGYFDDMVRLSKSIDFCRVMLLFHPFAKMYAVDTGKEATTRQMNEMNKRTQVFWDFETTTGSFLSDPRLVQAAPKHHYWWLWNVLFEREVEVAFLEEDHVVTPDFYFVAKTLSRRRPKLCPECIASNLAYHNLDYVKIDVEGQSNSVSYSIVNNIGLAFNRTMFRTIQEHIQHFCDFNDYNWDNTLIHMNQIDALPEPSFTTLVTRVLHIGSCGMHTHNSNCDSNPAIDDFERRISKKLPKGDTFKVSKFSKEWRESAYSSRPLYQAVEGWSDGRLWDPERPGFAKEFWESDINVQHCRKVSEGFGVVLN